MQDKRVARGSTYAAMVIPAGTNPEAMMSKGNSNSGTQDFKKKTFNKTGTNQVGNGHQLFLTFIVQPHSRTFTTDLP